MADIIKSHAIQCEYGSALFTLTRMMLIKNGIMQISMDKPNQIDWALIISFSTPIYVEM